MRGFALTMILLLAIAGAAGAQDRPAEPAYDPPPAEPPAQPAEPSEPVTADEEIPAEPPAPTWEPLSMTPVVDQFYTGVTGSTRTVLRTEEAWAGFWRELRGDEDPIPPPPFIDFGAQIVVVAAMGERPTGGYVIDITAVDASEDGLRVEVVEMSPGEGCTVNDAVSAPVKAVAVDRVEGEATFVEHQVVQPCE